MADDEERDDSAPGWEAIDDALAEIYGEREPDRHYGTVLKWSVGGDDPLDGLSAYKVTDDGPPHWHIVSYGMTELYGKDSDNPDESGWGFEFTTRIACAPDDEEPPPWALNFLQNIGRYVFNSGNVFAAGHHMNINGPIALGEETQIHAIAFAEPPKLPTHIDSPHGSFGFLHVVGVTLDELDAMQRWNSDGVLEILRERDPLLITDIARRNALDDPDAAERVEAGRKRDGSSQGGVFVSRLEWTTAEESVQVTMGALAVRGLKRMMEGRALFDRASYVAGPEHMVILEPGETFGWSQDENRLAITLPRSGAHALLDLEPVRGEYQFDVCPGLTLTIEPSEVTDRDGNVVETIG